MNKKNIEPFYPVQFSAFATNIKLTVEWKHNKKVGRIDEWVSHMEPSMVECVSSLKIVYLTSAGLAFGYKNSVCEPQPNIEG